MLSNWIPNPIHPAVVHLPVALAVLLPLVAVIALITINRGAKARAAWAMTVGTAALLVIGSWVALETGEDQEEKVEQVVAEQPLHDHEESAEAFIVVAVAMLGVSLVGLFPGRAGSVARGVATVGTLGVLLAGWRVGHSGGELVYRHGAAAAYSTAVPAVGVRPSTVEDEH